MVLADLRRPAARRGRTEEARLAPAGGSGAQTRVRGRGLSSQPEDAMGWELLGRVPARELRGAREQAHWAVQVIAASGESCLAHAADTSHTAMTWDAALGSLVGRALPGEPACRVAVRVADLTLCLLGPESEAFGRIELAGRTLDEAYRWTAQSLREATRSARPATLVHPGFELPAHPLALGGRFERSAGLGELAHWYANADAALRRLARETRGAGPVLCWPHHFDIATLIEIARAPAGGAACTVGAGLSPGDASCEEPYVYVNHWPATARRALPPLAAGEWITGSWVGAVLRGSELVAAGDASDQEGLLRAFLASAIDASRALALEAAPGAV